MRLTPITAKNTVFHLISRYGNLEERPSFRVVSSESPKNTFVVHMKRITRFFYNQLTLSVA